MYYYSKNDDSGNFKAEKYKIEIEVNILNTTRDIKSELGEWRSPLI